MAAFKELNWSQFDVRAIVDQVGIAVVNINQRDACDKWLHQKNYNSTSFDFANGIGPVIVELGEKLKWLDQFGYELTPDRRNLDALRDGFDFECSTENGHVLMFYNSDVAQKEDSRWFEGLLSIASEYSRIQLAIGLRFFVVLFLDSNSPLINIPFDTLRVPSPFWTAATHGNPFAG